jgi:predicted outer membrane lipoprotein
VKRVKKFLLVILGVPLAVAVIATALGYEAPDEQAEPQATMEADAPTADSKVEVPLKVLGPDKTYVAEDSATVRNVDSGLGNQGVVTVSAKESGVNTCAPNEDTQSPEKWCRGGLNVHAFAVNVKFKDGKSEECYEDRDSFWGYEGEYEDISMPCLFELDIEDIAFVELLGSTP